MTFTITKGEYIELIQLLKALSLASSGAEAKMMVEDGCVKLNGVVESRKRAKVRSGDLVQFEDIEIKII